VRSLDNRSEHRVVKEADIHKLRHAEEGMQGGGVTLYDSDRVSCNMTPNTFFICIFIISITEIDYKLIFH